MWVFFRTRIVEELKLQYWRKESIQEVFYGLEQS